VVALYLLANISYVVTLPLEGIQRAPQNRVATSVMQVVLGTPGTVAMAVAIMISTFGCSNGLILAGARVSYAMARDGLLFERVGRVNPHKVPAAALVIQGVWAAMLTLPRTVTTNQQTGVVTFGNVYTQLLEYIIPADLVLYILMVAAVIVLRRKAPDMPRPYRAWGYPVVPVIYVALATLVVVDLGYLAPSTSGVGYLIVLASFPVYLLWRRGASARVSGSDRSDEPRHP
jgi:APA family basic amino acid/polyamine antiporter